MMLVEDKLKDFKPWGNLLHKENTRVNVKLRFYVIKAETGLVRDSKGLLKPKMYKVLEPIQKVNDIRHRRRYYMF